MPVISFMVSAAFITCAPRTTHSGASDTNFLTVALSLPLASWFSQFLVCILIFNPVGEGFGCPRTKRFCAHNGVALDCTLHDADLLKNEGLELAFQVIDSVLLKLL